MEDVNEFANCRFYGGVGKCGALRDTYCLSDGKCAFYKPRTAGAEARGTAPKNKYNGLSDDKIARIRDLYSSGMTQKDIAMEVHASRRKVSKYVKGI